MMITFWQIGYYTVLAVIVGLGLLFIVTLVPIPGNYETRIVQSGSMEPSIGISSIVVIQPADNYQTGDVITYHQPGQAESVPITHRVVDTEVVSGRYLYTTQGDANEDPDPRPVQDSQIIGKVLFNLPYLGYLLDFARRPLGFALLIGLPAGVIIFDESRRIYREVFAARNS